jgi:hypothetical protein
MVPVPVHVPAFYCHYWQKQAMAGITVPVLNIYHATIKIFLRKFKTTRGALAGDGRAKYPYSYIAIIIIIIIISVLSPVPVQLLLDRLGCTGTGTGSAEKRATSSNDDLYLYEHADSAFSFLFGQHRACTGPEEQTLYIPGAHPQRPEPEPPHPTHTQIRL